MSIASRFACTGFAHFINTGTGRIVRIVAGAAFIAWGALQWGESYALALIIVGLIPLVAGAFDLCLISALLAGPISGDKVREAGAKEAS